MSKILFLKGLPGSGKSTFAKKLMEKEPDKWKRVNKDDLRAMLDGGVWSKANEAMVVKARDFLIETAIHGGKNVIVDDTNFAPIHEKTIRELAEKLGVEVEVKFLDVPLNECILRDAGRGDKSVGRKVIVQMHRSYLQKPYEAPRHGRFLPNFVICDIDGTLAHMVSRGPYDWHRVGEDVVDVTIKRLIADLYEQATGIILLSGRDEVCRAETEKWLADNGILYTHLFMRPEGNNEKDSIIKERLYTEHIEGKCNIEFVLDDRQQVVDMWRAKGLKCLQVAEGNF